MHTPFKLSASDEVILSTVSGKVVDSITLKPVTSGYSLGRSAEDTTAWKEMLPSPGYPNTSEGAAQYLATLSATAEEEIGVYLNEFMASNASTLIGPDGAYCDWIELYNTTGAEVDLKRVRHFGFADPAAEIYPARGHEDPRKRRAAHLPAPEGKRRTARTRSKPRLGSPPIPRAWCSPRRRDAFSINTTIPARHGHQLCAKPRRHG